MLAKQWHRFQKDYTYTWVCVAFLFLYKYKYEKKKKMFKLFCWAKNILLLCQQHIELMYTEAHRVAGTHRERTNRKKNVEGYWKGKQGKIFLRLYARHARAFPMHWWQRSSSAALINIHVSFSCGFSCFNKTRTYIYLYEAKRYSACVSYLLVKRAIKTSWNL